MNKFTPHFKYIFWGLIAFLLISNIANLNSSIQSYLNNKNKIEALTNKASCYREVAKLYALTTNGISIDEASGLNKNCFSIYNAVFEE